MSHTLLIDPVLGAALFEVVKNFIFVVFITSAVLLTIVVLLQEGKGGGLGSAFGGAAADAFGVKAGAVNRFTAWLAATFLGLALLYSGLNAQGDKITAAPMESPADSDLPPDGPAVIDRDAEDEPKAPQDDAGKDDAGKEEAPESPDAPEAPEAPEAPVDDAPKAPEDDG